MRSTPEGIAIAFGGILLGVMALILGGIFQFFFVMIIVWVLFEYDAKFHDLQSRLTEMEKRLAKNETSQSS